MPIFLYSGSADFYFSAGRYIGDEFLYSFIGSLPWCFFLTYLGLKLGENWMALKPWFHRFDFFIVAALIGVVLWWLVRRRRR